MGYIEVAQVSQVPPGGMKSLPAGDREVLIASYEGMYYALGNKCPHAGGDLSAGKLEGKIVTCPKHGSKYEVTTGRCVLGPKTGFLRLKARNTQVYEIKVDGNSLKIDIQGLMNR